MFSKLFVQLSFLYHLPNCVTIQIASYFYLVYVFPILEPTEVLIFVAKSSQPSFRGALVNYTDLSSCVFSSKDFWRALTHFLKLFCLLETTMLAPMLVIDTCSSSAQPKSLSQHKALNLSECPATTAHRFGHSSFTHHRQNWERTTEFV